MPSGGRAAGPKEEVPMAAVPNPPPVPTLSAQAQAQVTAFNASLDAVQRINFANALNGSPALVAQINSAVAANQLNGFSLLAPGTHAGGQFNPATKTMELPASIISSPARGPHNPNELTFVMGHEIQHAINAPAQAAASQTFVNDVRAVAQGTGATHDYTAAVSARLQANRNDEATAHIAGYNALVGMVRNTNATPSIEDIYRAHPGRMNDFIAVTPGTPNTYALRPGLTLNADMTMTPNAANTTAMGQHYYGQPASAARIGPNGDSDYQNYYGTAWIGYAAQVERAYAPTHAAAGRNPQFTLDMAALGVNEVQLERNGLNLGGAGNTQAYTNTGTTPPTQGTFHHTAGTNQHVPITLPVVPSPVDVAQPNPAVRQAMDALDRSPNIAAADFGADRERVAAGVALHAANHGLSPDHVVLNDRRTDLIVVQGNLSDPAARLSPPLAVSDALRTDPATVQQRLEAQAQTPPTPTQANTQDVPNQGPPNQDAPRPPR
jgi:hypothetical protein